MTYDEAFKMIYDTTYNGNKELLDCFLMVDEALYERHKLIEKQKKYVWHNIRKNPDDLPRNETKCLIMWAPGRYDVSTFYTDMHDSFKYDFDENEGSGFVYYDSEVGYVTWAEVIAWRELEPFEEGVE